MPLWKLEPAADLNDARWLDHRRWAEVVVRAATPGEARHAAASFEALDAPHGVGNETPTFEAGLADEKLYRLTRVEDETGRNENEGDDDDRRPAVVSATPYPA